MAAGESMADQNRFQTLYAPHAGEAAGPAAARLICPPRPRPGETVIDLFVGLLMRAALAVQYVGWAADNTSGGPDWRSWVEPEPGLAAAAGVWTLGWIDPQLAAVALLGAALGLGAALAFGFLTRLAGLLTAAGALWYALFVLPEAWAAALAWGALGVYLALRGAGVASIDWSLARLSRLG